MKNKRSKKKKPDDSSIREIAESEMKKRKTKQQREELSYEDTQSLVHELQVHQIELEMQNEELRHAQEVIEESRQKYTELYDFAPVGYFTLDKKGVVVDINLTGASQLGIERGFIVGKPFSLYIDSDYKSTFFLHREKVFKKGGRYSCELRLIRKDGSRFDARLDSILSENQMCFTSVSNISNQKKAESELLDSEEKYRAIYNGAWDGVVLVDYETGLIADCNPQFERQTGRELSKLREMKIWEIRPPAKIVTAKNKFLEIKKEGLGGSKELDFQSPDGKIVPIDFVSREIEIKGKKYLHSITRDITERKRAEEEMRESGVRFQELFNSMSSGAAVYMAKDNGNDFIFVDFNRSAERIEDIKKEDVIGKSVLKVFPGVKDFGLFDVLQRVWKTGTPENLPVSIYKDKRISGWRENHVYKLPSGEIVAVYDDVTERKRAEHDLEKYREHLEERVEERTAELSKIASRLKEAEAIGLLGHWELDLVTNILYWSDGIYSIFDLNPSEFGASYEAFLDTIHPEDREFVDKSYTDAVKNRTTYDIVHRLLMKDGSVKFVSEKCKTDYDEDGKPLRSVGTVQDITERKLMEEEMLKAQRHEALGVLAGGVAHDFNNTLTSIMNSLYITKMALKPGDEALRRLELAERSVRSAQSLTRQLSAFAVGGEPIKKALAIGGLIEDAALFALRGSNIKCKFDMAPDLWTVECEEGMISQAISNIVINADQAMPDGGTVNVKAENVTLGSKDRMPLDEGRYVKLSIKDNGLGIPEERLPKIFDPFFTTKDIGSGLGLASVYSVVNKHGGQVTVESKLGKGSTFHIYLPASDKQVFETIKEMEMPYSGRVLLMDDEALIVESVALGLKDLGFKVEYTYDGKKAIDLYKIAMNAGVPFDVIVLDLTVPGGMGGKETIKRLRKLNPDVKAILASGYASDPAMANYAEQGFVGAMLKPYDVGELSRMLDSIIAG
jgi:PAS domain S-box-containing protein